MAQLADPATYGQEGAAIAELKSKLEHAREHARALTDRWEELESRKAEHASRS